MGRFDDILLTADFDRTLTAPDSTIPQRNLTAIREFIAEGGAFTVNTGRSIPMSGSFLDTVPVNAPLLLYNGSAAYDVHTGEVSLCYPIQADMWQTLDAIATRYPQLNLEVQGVHAHYSYGKRPDWETFYEAACVAHGQALPSVDMGPFLKMSMFGTIREHNVAHLFAGSPEEIRQFNEIEAWLRQTFGDRMEIFRAAARIIDVHAKGVSKINAARALQKKLGRKILVCIGDGENDVPMLEGADHAYCPADGAVADRFENVCPCAEGAVADVIYKKIPEIIRK